LAPGHPPMPALWHEVQEPTTSGRPARWAPESHLVLLLDTDGFRCLWGQGVDAASGRLEGLPFAVRHFHDEPGMGTSLGNPVTPGGFVYEGRSITGNLWRLTAARTP
jgi:hypothetical protein